MNKIQSEKLNFLNSYRRNTSNIDRLLEMADVLQEEFNQIKERAYIRLLPKSNEMSDGLGGCSGNNNDKLAEVMADLIDIERDYLVKIERIAHEIKLLEKRNANVINAIMAVTDDSLCQILFQRFIRMETWNEVAKKCNYAPKTLKNYKKAQAVNAISEKYLIAGKKME